MTTKDVPIPEGATIRRDPVEADPDALTPVERATLPDGHGHVWLKRDDAFMLGGSRGGKVRACLTIVRDALAHPDTAARAERGLVTAGARESPQVNIVATVGRHLGLPVRVHVPAGAMSPETLAAAEKGADVITHRPGYNTVIIARARKDADERGWFEVPFGMEHSTNLDTNARQTLNLPVNGDGSLPRLVLPVGSGMTLAGLLWGLKEYDSWNRPVLGVRVGAFPLTRIDRWAPPDWRDVVTLVESADDYHRPARAVLDGVLFDPHYEAKCVPFLEDGDVMWVTGRRATLEAHNGS